MKSDLMAPCVIPPTWEALSPDWATEGMSASLGNLKSPCFKN